ncbi:MAG: toprim domain-containing protein [Isosphaerales bacterium]
MHWKPPGVLIPWFDGDQLKLVKIRPTDEWRARFPKDRPPPKYIEAFRDRPLLYPTPSVVSIGKPMVIAEGEFDALLLGQELRELAAVATLGSASARPEPAILGTMLKAPTWHVATDADTAGDQAASRWRARARRARPPAPYKDWTEAWQAGVNLRRWWIDRIAGIESPAVDTG